MISAIIYPISLSTVDAAQQSATPPEVGWFVSMPDDFCAFCQVGACVQRVVSSMGEGSIVIHGPLGEA